MLDTKDFRIKTKFYKRPNGTIGDLWICGIDIGYSSVKTFSPNSVNIFPSFAILDNSKEIGTPKDTFIKYKDLKTGDTWIVGDVAQSNIKQNDTSYTENSLYGRERYDDPMFLVLVNTAIGLSCMKNDYGDPAGKNIKIETGLPSMYLDRDKDLLKQSFIGERRFSLKVGSGKEVVFNINLKENDIDVMEQPMGTLMSIAIDDNHKFVSKANNYFNKNVIIFDGGHGTLDTFVIKNNRVVDKQTFPEYSMKQVLKNTINKIRENLQIDVSPVAIQNSLETGSIMKYDRFSSKSIPINDILEKENNKVFEKAIEQIGRIYSLFEFDYFVITGGTGAAWSNKIKDKLKNIEGLEFIDGNTNDPTLPQDFSNARGYYMYLYQSELRNQKSK